MNGGRQVNETDCVDVRGALSFLLATLILMKGVVGAVVTDLWHVTAVD